MRAPVAVTTTLALAGATIAVIACEQVLSIDGAVSIAPGSACGLPVAAGACQSCVASSCCAEATACAAEQECSDFESCVLGCGPDYVCRTQCNVTHQPGPGKTVPTFDQCVATSCNQACGTQCGLTASPSSPDAAAACSECITGKVCSPVQACASSLECAIVERCVSGCRTVDCHDTCLANDDAGLFTAVEVGLIGACLRQCQLGNLWTCVGGVSWPLAPAGVNTVDFSVVDSSTNAPVPDPVVKACNKTDLDCASPVASTTGSSMGLGTLDMPSHAAVGLGFGGYYDIDATAHGEMHWLVFASSPLTEAQASFMWTVLSQSNLATLLGSAGLMPMAGMGHVAVGAVDCLVSNASDVVVTATTGSGMDLSAQRYYLAGGALSKIATATDLTGYAFFFNVPPGSVTVTATPRALGRVSSTQIINVRASTVSSVVALPTPQ